MLNIQDICFHIAGKSILENVSMFVSNKQHTGLVGRNGSGKSTLFKIIQGSLEHDHGKVNIEKGCKVISIKQEMPSGNITPRDFLLSQDIERKNLMEKLVT